MTEKNGKIKKIIFIIADTLRAQNVGLYGKNPSPTPNIDKLGKQGVLFLNAYTSITKTDSSITAIMAGMHSMSTGLTSHGQWLKKEQKDKLEKITFLSEILHRNGYFTAGIDCMGRWHSRGFDYYSGKIKDGIDSEEIANSSTPFLKYLRILDLFSLKFFKRDFFSRFYYCFFKNPLIPYDTADLVVNQAIRIIEKQKQKKLFLYLHFRDPHFPHVKPSGLKSYLSNSIEDRYNTVISFMDKEIGRLIAYLDKTGELKESLIIFTADHGESLFEHNVYLAHHDPYETIVKIPLIVYNPSLSPCNVDVLVQNIDIFPTILDFIGVERKDDIDGISLIPFIKGKKKKREFVFFEDNIFGESYFKKSRRKRGIRVGKYKYIQTLTGKDKDLFAIFPKNFNVTKEELYDVKIDPAEKKNIIERNKKITIQIKKIMEDYVKAISLKKK